MIDPEKLAELGKPHRFSKENQPAKRGRKPSRWKKFTKEYDISDKDRERMARLILSKKSKDEIFELLKDGKIPFGVWAACVATIADAKKGGTGFLKYLNDAAFGKIPDKTEGSLKIDYTDMSKEDRLERIKELEELARLRKQENEEKDNDSI